MSQAWNEMVWEMVLRIPFGKVATYGQIAAMLGHPRRARHVGFALHRSSEALQLPWHRVINSAGKISFPPDSEHYHMQRALLEAEGVLFSEKGRVSLQRFAWQGLVENTI